MTLISISRKTRIDFEVIAVLFAGNIPDEPNPPRLINIVPTKKNFRTLHCGLEQIAQCWNRTIMQVRCSQPDAVEWLVRIAEGFAEMFEAILGIRSVEEILIHTQIE